MKFVFSIFCILHVSGVFTQPLRTLHQAIFDGDIEYIQQQLEEEGQSIVNFRNLMGDTLLHQAVFHRQTSIVRLLAEHPSIQIDAENPERYSPLSIAVHKGPAEIVRILLENGANPLFRTRHKLTLLHSAIDVEIAQLLLNHGVDLNARNSNGETPLHRAVLRGRHKVARFLISKGADIYAKDKDGSTVFHSVSDLQTAQSLLRLGLDINVRDHSGKTLFHDVARRGLTDIVLFFLDKVDLADQDKKGNTALHFAVMNDHVEVAQILLKKGASASIENKKHKTSSLYSFSRYD